MDYAKLKEEIREIADIAAGVPDTFKEKCFEILLNHLITGLAPSPPPEVNLEVERDSAGESTPQGRDLPVTTQLRVFMERKSISEEQIKTILMVADGDVHFLREPTHGKVATGQIEWALLLALKNCILNNVLSVDPEDVRSVCQDKGFYDASNFAANFKKEKNAKLFKGTMEGHGEAQTLTIDGQTELAQLIKTLSAGSE